MDTPEYEKRAALTAPDSATMHLQMIPERALYGVLQNLRSFEPDINACKKILVYGPKAPQEKTACLAIYEERDPSPFKPGAGFTGKVAHGIIGVLSESLELSDNLITSLFGGDELDVENIKEEVGDILWYLARLAKACDFTLADAMDGNIAKLEIRHLNVTGGFNSDAATEEGRDREAEKAAAQRAMMGEGVKPLEKRLEDLQSQLDIATSDGNYNADPYMHGLANGIIMANATIRDIEPQFLRVEAFANLPGKQSSPEMSTLAAKLMDYTKPGEPLPDLSKLITDARSLAGSVMSQDETKGQTTASE